MQLSELSPEQAAMLLPLVVRFNAACRQRRQLTELARQIVREELSALQYRKPEIDPEPQAAYEAEISQMGAYARRQLAPKRRGELEVITNMESQT